MKTKSKHPLRQRKRSLNAAKSVESNVLIPMQCPQCGIPQSQWLNPYQNAQGENYCCEGCTEETGCLCQNQVG